MSIVLSYNYCNNQPKLRDSDHSMHSYGYMVSRASTAIVTKFYTPHNDHQMRYAWYIVLLLHVSIRVTTEIPF